MDNTEVKVAEWNTQYHALRHELKDMPDAAYEAIVAEELFSVCGEDAELAAAVFNHPNNKGGWYAGDVLAYIKRKFS